MLKSLKTVGLCIASVFLILGLVFNSNLESVFQSKVYPGFPKNAPFNRVYWRAYPHKRLSMVASLLKKHSLDNQTEKQVISLLGKPDYYKNHSLPNEKVLCYKLSTKSDFKDAVLEIAIVDGRVVECIESLNLNDPMLPDSPHQI